MNWLLASDVSSEVQQNIEEIGKEVSGLTKALDTVANKLIDFGFSLAVAIVIFIIGKIAIKLVRKLVKNIFNKSSADVTVAKFVDSLVKFIGYVIVIIIICGKIGIETTSFITLLGTAGLSIGLALQGSLANFAGGVLILLSKPFTIGDYVMIDGEEGTVAKIDIIYTTIVKADNRVIKCPNGEVANKVVVNYSNQEGRRVDVKFSIHYDSDIAKAKDIVKKLILNSEYVLKDKNNDVVVTLLDESGVNLETRAWVKSEDYWNAYFYFTEQIKYELEKNDIIIPYKQLEVYVKNDN